MRVLVGACMLQRCLSRSARLAGERGQSPRPSPTRSCRTTPAGGWWDAVKCWYLRILCTERRTRRRDFRRSERASGHSVTDTRDTDWTAHRPRIPCCIHTGNQVDIICTYLFPKSHDRVQPARRTRRRPAIAAIRIAHMHVCVDGCVYNISNSYPRHRA